MTWHLTTAQRVENGKKAAATMKREGRKLFGGKRGHHKGRHDAFAHLTKEQRTERARKAAQTRRERGH